MWRDSEGTIWSQKLKDWVSDACPHQGEKRHRPELEHWQGVQRGVNMGSIQRVACAGFGHWLDILEWVRGVETPRFLARDRVTGGATLRWFANGPHLSYQSYSPPFTPRLCARESRPVWTASPGFLGPLVSGRVWSLDVISKRLWWLASLITSMAAASTRQPFLHMQVKSPSWTFRSSADNSFPLWLQIPYWIC